MTNTSGAIVLAKYDGNGNTLWVRQVKPLENDADFFDTMEGSGGVFADAAGNVYQTGSCNDSSSLDFGGLIMPGGKPSGINAYVAKYDGAGNILWAQDMFNVSNQGIPDYITGDAFGNIFVAGNFWDSNSAILASCRWRR